MSGSVGKENIYIYISIMLNENMTTIDRLGGQAQRATLSRGLCHFLLSFRWHLVFSKDVTANT